MLEFDLSATAVTVQINGRTFGGMRRLADNGTRAFDKYEIMANANRIGEQAIELLDAEDCPTGEMDV